MQKIMELAHAVSHALTVDRKDIKVCFRDEKSKSLNIAVQCLYSVFSKSSLLTCDSFR